ncbi:hypothetical protein KAT08_02200 [Candidatus Babeliales bacterium]|nr:hypothetical protein [Candidatus Babeliales bacterium]
MNIRFFLFCITTVLISSFSNIVPAIGGKGYVIHKVDKKDVKEGESALRSGKLEILTQDDLKKENKRFINVTNDIVFDKTAFYSSNYFYLGAAFIEVIGNIKSSTLVRAYIIPGATPSQDAVSFVTLAPEQANVNSAQENKELVLTTNPIYDKRVTNLTLMGNKPVITFASGVDDDNKKIALVNLVEQSEKYAVGSLVKINTENINDASGADATDEVVGLAASSDTIFAAVSPKDKFFKEENSGIAVVVQKDNKLKAINSVTGNQDENRAFGISTDLNPADGFVSVSINNLAQIGGLGDMYWDSSLNRLFIGLTSVERVNDAIDGGVISLLVGRIVDGKLIIETAVTGNADLFENNSSNFIFGFRYDDDVNVSASVRKIKTMHTSTGKSYLIVNSGVGIGSIKNEVYALPLVKTGDVEDIGKIAKKNDLTQVIEVVGDMTRKDEDPAKIGRGSVPIEEDKSIEDMFVVGDSVFVCVSQDISGIFRSTAIFDGDGIVRSWTAWQRVMGNVDKVFGAGMDSILGNYWYLTEDVAGDKNTVKITRWGKSIEENGLMGNGLVELLTSEFTQQNGGVHQIFNFDEYTPSLSRDDAGDRVSMMVATGFQKIALIKTGEGNPFTPLTQFRKDDEVFIFEGDVLENIGPICCSDVSRIQAANSGWLFVGGDGGIAVLRNGVTGNGWPSQVDDDAVDFENIVNNFSFKNLTKDDGTSFSQVRKILCDGPNSRLYIMSADNIYRAAMDNPNKFLDVGALDLNEKEITKPSGILLDMLIVYNNGVNIRLLAATTSGLFISDNIDNIDGDKVPTWSPITLSSGAQIASPVIHLNFISTTKGGSTTDGNLYVMTADFSLNISNIYRFNVYNGVVIPITESSGTNDFYSIGEMRSNFVTDGSLGFHMLSKHFGQTDFLKRISIISTKSSIRNGEKAIDLDLENNAYNVGIMVQNTASGAWIVPGDWGIRVNE